MYTTYLAIKNSHIKNCQWYQPYQLPIFLFKIHKHDSVRNEIIYNFLWIISCYNFVRQAAIPSIELH